MAKKERYDKRKKISQIKKKYFITHPEITTEQIQILLTITNEYLTSINLNFDSKFKHRILQSTISLVIHSNESPVEEHKEQ